MKRLLYLPSRSSFKAISRQGCFKVWPSDNVDDGIMTSDNVDDGIMTSDNVDDGKIAFVGLSLTTAVADSPYCRIA
jgi:hypothetical protein